MKKCLRLLNINLDYTISTTTLCADLLTFLHIPECNLLNIHVLYTFTKTLMVFEITEQIECSGYISEFLHSAITMAS